MLTRGLGTETLYKKAGGKCLFVSSFMQDFSYKEGTGQEKMICPEDKALKQAPSFQPQDLRERL